MSEKKAIVAGIIAAIAYWSWPLGYITNRSVAANSLASDLEAHSQPYSWLFISLDCVTGIAVLIAIYFAWTNQGPHRTLRNTALVSFAVFGIATAVDALIPLNCSSSGLSGCGSDLSHLNLDDYLTGLALIGLFLAAVFAQIRVGRELARSLASWSLNLATLAFIVCGLVFLQAHFSNQPPVLLQHLMLTFTSVLTLLIPVVLVRDGEHTQVIATQHDEERVEVLTR